MGYLPIKKGFTVTRCRGRSSSRDSSSSWGAPIVNLPPGMETISSSTAPPKLSMKCCACLQQGLTSLPLASTFTTSNSNVEITGGEHRGGITAAFLLAVELGGGTP